MIIDFSGGQPPCARAQHASHGGEVRHFLIYIKKILNFGSGRIMNHCTCKSRVSHCQQGLPVWHVFNFRESSNLKAIFFLISMNYYYQRQRASILF